MASVILAALVTLGWCSFAIWLGPRIGYVDRPDDPSLKAHERPAVPLGGVGIFLGIHLAALLRGGLDRPLLAASAMVLVLGQIDDRRGVAPFIRLGAETLAALVLVLGGSSGGDGPLLMFLGVVLVVLAINAVNLLDGLDGLAASVALVASLGVAWLAAGRGLDAPAAHELGAALAGFLVLNWHPARVFLGDGGAYVVGLVLAHLILDSSPGGALELTGAGALLGVFALDLIVTLLRRRLNDRRLFTGDRRHVYDQLRDRGTSVRAIATVAAASQAALVVAVVVADRLLTPWQSLVALGVLLAVLLVWLARLGFLRVDTPQG